MTEEHLFISDVHLGAFDPEKEQEIESDLVALIEYAKRKKARLYILGDLFDYWMEFQNSSVRPTIGLKTLDSFKNYHENVESSLFITGNHDNWTLGYFTKIGFDVESEYRSIELFGKKLFLMHGDGHFKSNEKLNRPFMHRVLRNPFFLKLYRNLLPNSIALSVMKQFSDTTRKLNHRNPIPLNTNAEYILDSGTAEIVITGHDHIPRLETFNSGLYINLGTFFQHRTLVRGINGVLSLVQWDAQNQTFNDFKSNT